VNKIEELRRFILQAGDTWEEQCLNEHYLAANFGLVVHYVREEILSLYSKGFITLRVSDGNIRRAPGE
jgi:hypothetical protein